MEYEQIYFSLYICILILRQDIYIAVAKVAMSRNTFFTTQ